MKLIVQIALKFLFGKKSKGIINVISTISIVGVAVGAIALLVILSVFNGLNGLIGNLYGSFDPDIQVTAVSGKYFSLDSLQMNQLKAVKGVNYVCSVIEDNAHLKYGKRQSTGIIMGVDSNFVKVSKLDSILVDGKYNLKDEQTFGGVIGYALADQLNVRLSFLTPLVINVPQRNKKINIMRPYEAFNTHYVYPKGIFMVKQVDYDAQYLIIDIDLSRKLFQYNNSEVTSLFIDVKDGSNAAAVQKAIERQLGDKFEVKDRHQQHETFYKMMSVEKMVAYLIMCFILIIATFNLIGTMSMLIFDKKEGIRILKSIGANKKMITKVFLVEGWLISIIGVAVGLLLGCLIVFLQSYFGIIKFSSGANFVVDAYPVELKAVDVFYTFLTVSTIGFFAAWYPVKVIVRKYFNSTY